MKAINLIIATLLVASCAMFIGCKSSASKVEDAKEDVVKAKETLEVAKEEYLEDVKQSRIAAAESIDANNRSLAELKEKISKEKKQIKEKYEKQIAELEQKNNEIKRKLDNYQVEGRDEWQVFKKEFNHDLDELGRALSDLTTKNVK